MNYVLKAILLSVFALLLVSCSKGNDKASNIDPRTGKHPSGWAVAGGGKHALEFLSVSSSCFECHGKNLNSGISGVSCFTAARSGINCHANGPGQHPAGWSDAAVHGAHAKAKSAATGVDGFTRCQVCHGSDYSGGIVKKSCLNTAGCHGASVSAPHAAKPWLSRLGASTHHTTDATNATACAACHTAGANSDRKPSTPAPAGTAPGCFNNTLCHGVEGHATGWNLPINHGAAAKAAAGGDKGFSACIVCHGANYAGGTAQQSCLSTAGCHGAAVNAPHPAAPWRSTVGGLTHTATSPSNDAQCAVCHTGGLNSTRKPRAGDPVGISGCFNNTLCHGTVGHAAGWAAAAVHGAEAKKAPSGSTGFSSCQPCHGTTFNNGTATTCMNNAACHGSGVNSPHARKPWFSRVAGLPTHTTTDVANVGICAACHTGGANSTLGNTNAVSGTAGCFNNTLCHFHQIPFAPSATVPVTLHSSEAKKNLSICQGCHGQKGTTAFDGATLAGGTRTIACSSCHTAAKAHPTDWQGSGTFSHRTAGNINIACIICHDVTQGRSAPLPAAPSCFSATFTNGAAQTRTCHASGPGVVPHVVPYNNHNATARSNFNYCLGCHQVAATATGRPGCQNCHLTSPVATPNGCISCHASPPGGATYPNIANVHVQHVSASKVTVMTLACDDCHANLGLGTIDHLNRARARTITGRANPVAFSSGTLLVAGGGTASSFNDTTGQCANVYCHGAKMPGGDTNGSTRTPTWAPTPLLPTTISAAACGICHGFPPTAASGHPSITIPAGFPATALGTTCSCHTNINTQTATATTYANVFVDLSKHINGTLETPSGSVHAVPYPGSVHFNADTTTCSACHALGTGASQYGAVLGGAAPDCKSCHLFSTATAMTDMVYPKCSDCHGSAANDNSLNDTLPGRPNGAIFPNRPGRHNLDPEHTGFSCTVCHPFKDTSASHGWSNRTKSTDAQVRVLSAAEIAAGTLGITAWNPATNQCSATDCHGSAVTRTW